MERVKIPNSSGKGIAAIIQYPEVPANKLAILCPGFLDTKDYNHLAELSTVLSGAGYATVRFDPTGTWESEGDISEYLTSQYLRDIQSVLEYMLTKGSYTRVLLGGHSRGGQVSILYAARDPRISSVLAIMPSSGRGWSGAQLQEWESAGFAVSTRDIPGDTGRREFRVPFTHALDRDQFETLEDVKKVHAPIIFVAGEKDEIVLPEDVKALFDAANEPKKFVFIKDIGHDYRHNMGEVATVNAEIMRAVVELVSRNWMGVRTILNL
jgi:pimeloyl-ACP methyl ester carboxylesterase